MSDGNAPPGWYLAPGGRKRWWDGHAWHDQRTDPAAVDGETAVGAPQVSPTVASPSGAVSGVAIAGLILSVIGIVLAVNAYTKSMLFLGLADIFGPVVLGALGAILAAISGRRGGGFRVAGLICGLTSCAAGLLLIYAITSR